MKTRIVIAFAAIGLVAVVVWRFAGKPQPTDLPRGERGSMVAADGGLAAFMSGVERFCLGPTDGPGSRRALEELAARIAAMPREVAVRAIQDLLNSGRDHATGIDFKPDGRGGLAGSSSLRVFLLDQLRKLDPVAARLVARSVLSRPTSPDEWAVSLAILATDADEASRLLVREKARELALHKPWQAAPTAGFLEAFDVFVYNRDTEFVPQLSSFLGQTNNQALAHAAFLSLDRLVQAAPAAALDALLLNPEWLRTREATRAGYFARADVRDPAQLALVEKFLAQEAFSVTERERFLGSFPAASFMVSQNLLTTSVTPNGTEIAARDQAALEVLKRWVSDPRFAVLKPAIESARDRLAKFVPPPR